MLLRRMISHVKAQNWVAVFLDFLIVVIGVFIGIQVSNWNEARAQRQEYFLAQDRLSAEITANIATLDDISGLLSDWLKDAEKAVTLLEDCAPDTEENRQTVSAGLRAISGTLGITLRSSALEQLTENTVLLGQQTEDERARYADMRYRLDFLEIEAKYAENLPLEIRVLDNPLVASGPIRVDKIELLGTYKERKRRDVMLAVPIDEACKDDRLRKSFYTWERWQRQQFYIAELMREVLNEAR